MACGDKCRYRQRKVDWFARDEQWYWDGKKKDAEEVRKISGKHFRAVNDTVDAELSDNRKKEWETPECNDRCPCDAFLIWRGRWRRYTMTKDSGKAKVEINFRWKWERYEGYCDTGWKSVVFIEKPIGKPRRKKA